MANSEDLDQMSRIAVSGLGLHCLQRPICPNTLGYYGKYCFYYSMKTYDEGNLEQFPTHSIGFHSKIRNQYVLVEKASYPKIWTHGSADPDLIGAVWSESSLFALICLFKYFR